MAALWLSIAILDLIFYWGVYLRWKLLQGNVVICDRYLLDTLLDFRNNFPNSYFEKSWLWRLLKVSIPKPSVSFLLWVPVAESIRRSQMKDEPFPDDEKTLTWRLDAYMNGRIFPTQYYTRIDCSRSIDIVFNEIKTYLGHIR